MHFENLQDRILLYKELATSNKFHRRQRLTPFIITSTHWQLTTGGAAISTWDSKQKAPEWPNLVLQVGGLKGVNIYTSPVNAGTEEGEMGT